MLLAVSVVLAAFLGLTGLSLDQAFRESAEEAARERLQGQVYLILGAAELDADGRLVLPAILPEPRFSSPASGLFAEIVDAGGRQIWVSNSTLSRSIVYPRVTQPGVAVFASVDDRSEDSLFALSFSVVWESENFGALPFVIHVAESKHSFDQQVERFRTTLLIWSSAAALVLLILQAAIWRWSLAPLRRVEQEVSDIEHGERERLSEDYPTELRGLTSNLNTLVSYGRSQLNRYRNALDDLAHSLKTPLAVLRSVGSEAPNAQMRDAITEQVSRMHETIDYQLQKAAASGRRPLTKPVDVKSCLEALQRSLTKVYAERSVNIAVDVEPGTVFFGDKGDLTEILGNLLDNACKWAAKEVRVTAYASVVEPDKPTRLNIVVEDDGPGMTGAAYAQMVKRGATASSERAGEGIGLAVVREIVEELYHGTIRLERSSLGGAAFNLGL